MTVREIRQIDRLTDRSSLREQVAQRARSRVSDAAVAALLRRAAAYEPPGTVHQESWG
jgi:hypothetical protein